MRKKKSKLDKWLKKRMRKNIEKIMEGESNPDYTPYLEMGLSSIFAIEKELLYLNTILGIIGSAIAASLIKFAFF